MAYTVSITSQGQISIPAKIRRDLKLDRYKKALLSVQDNNILIRPVKDLLELKGAFRDSAIKNKPLKEIIKLEKEAVGEAIAERYRRKMKKMGIKLPE